MSTQGEQMKPDDHARITKKAVQLFHQYCGNTTSEAMLHFIDELASGSKEADDFTLKRTRNWHFYNKWLVLPFTVPCSSCLLHFTPEHLIIKRDQQLNTAIQEKHSKQLFNLAGRILHHIQDMSTPSHVVPIYHGPIFKDSYETYLCKNYLYNSAHLDSIAAEINHETITRLQKITVNHILKIYQARAQKTMAYLQPANSHFSAMVNSQPKRLPWSMFWQPDQDKSGAPANRHFSLSGFGRFGPLGKKFGKTNPITIEEKTYQINSGEFHRLCRYFTRQALLDSLQTLMFFNKRIEGVEGS